MSRAGSANDEADGAHLAPVSRERYINIKKELREGTRTRNVLQPDGSMRQIPSALSEKEIQSRTEKVAHYEAYQRQAKVALSRTMLQTTDGALGATKAIDAAMRALTKARAHILQCESGGVDAAMLAEQVLDWGDIHHVTEEWQREEQQPEEQQPEEHSKSPRKRARGSQKCGKAECDEGTCSALIKVGPRRGQMCGRLMPCGFHKSVA